MENLALYTKLVDFISYLPGELAPIIKKQGYNLELHVFGKANVTSLMNMLAPYSHFFYWKRGQFTMLTRVLALLNLNIKNWLGLQKTILAIIYEIPGNRVYSITHWMVRLSGIYSARFSNVEFFISATRVKSDSNSNSNTNKGELTGWFVTLPKNLRIKPLQKYFSVGTYGDIDTAKRAALKYRDTTLDNWLKEFKP